MFLDDITDGVKDAVKTVGADLSSAVSDTYGAMSSVDSKIFSGATQAASTVSKVFGDLDLFDSALASNPIGRTLSEIADELNPQPLPPGPGESVFDRLSRRIGLLAEEAALNPQPLPPEPSESIFGRLGDAFAINPQPLPPSPEPIESFSRAVGEAVAINPQPLPPEPSESIVRKLGDLAGLNPQPLPPSPPEPNEAIASLATRTSQIGKMISSGVFNEVALNPQPLPPRNFQMLNGSMASRFRQFA